MRLYWRSLFLWLLVINMGIAVGAGLYESRVVIPTWVDLPPAAWPNTGLLFWVYVTTIPLTLLLSVNAVAVALEKGPRRRWWMAAVAVAIVERALTFGYFIPGMIALTGPDLSAGEVAEGLARWMWLNHGRHVLSVLAWLLALKALATQAWVLGGSACERIGSRAA